MRHFVGIHFAIAIHGLHITSDPVIGSCYIETVAYIMIVNKFSVYLITKDSSLR